MEVRVLGRLEVYASGRPIDIRRPRERALLTLLAAEPGVVSADRLIDGLWGELRPASAAKTLQTYIHHLRSLLPEETIVTEAGGYRLVAESLDWRMFLDEVEAAGREALEAGADRLREALALWRDTPFLDAEDAGWLAPLRTRLADVRIRAQIDLYERAVRAGRAEKVLPELRALVDVHPLREDLWGLYMLALYRNGRQAEALRAFGEARRRLAEELGIDPGPQLRDLEERILAHDPTLLGEGEGVSTPEPEPPPPAPEPAYEPVADHRRLTVIEVELLGSAGLKQRLDGDAGERVLDEIRQTVKRTVERFGGRVFEATDERLRAAFGVPRAHEDDTYRAIRAALRLSDAVDAQAESVRRSWGYDALSSRSTVSTLAAEVSPDGSMRFDEVEAAAERAPGGAVTVDDHTHRLVEDLFEWDRLTETDDQSPVWVPISTVRSAAKARLSRRHAPLVGREAELEEAAGFVSALDRGVGGVLLITGEAGVGKSRLVAELADRSTEVSWIVGHCASYLDSTPYGAFRDLFRAWLGLGVDDTDMMARIALHSRLDESVPSNPDRVYPYLGAMLGIELEPEHASRVDLASEALQYRTFEVVGEVIEEAASNGALVLVLEDVHWADPTSGVLLHHLLPLTERLPIAFVVTARPDPERRADVVVDDIRRAVPHRVTEIGLEALEVGDIRTLLISLIGGVQFPEHLQEQILDLAEGNPFYLEELVASLLEDGSPDPVHGVTVPETVEKVVQARIDRLERGSRELLTAASVLGRSFGLPLLQGVVGAEGVQVDDVQALLRAGLLIETRRWPQAEYVFRHALIQEAAHSTLPEDRRLALHRRAAEWLEQRHGRSADEVMGQLARHWASAGEDERAITALGRAGDLARRDHALDEAIAHYRTLLPLLEKRGDSPAVATVLFKLALALHNALRFSESRSVYRRAFEAWSPPPSPPATETLRFAGPPFFDVPDPSRSFYLNDIQLQMALFDRLVERFADDTLVPSLAESWEFADDGLSYRFTLREGLTWSDGHLLTAHDVEYGIMRNLDPERPNPGLAMFFVLEGARDYALGGKTDPAAVGVEALDDRVVEFRLEAPAPYFLAMLNRPDCGPQPRHAIEARGDAWCEIGREVVSGAFTRITHGETSVVLVRRPDYQGHRAGNVASVEWTTGQMEDRVDAFLRGEVDLLWETALGGRWAPDLGDSVRFEPPAGLMYLAFRLRGHPVTDVRVRQALAHGLDRRVLAETLPANLEAATGGMVPPVLAGHTPDVAPPFDPAEGRRLLDMVEDMSKLEFAAPRGDRGRIIREIMFAVAEMWRENLGLEVGVNLFEPEEADTIWEGDDPVPHGACAFWYPGYTDPEYFLRLLLHSDALSNYGRFSDPDYDALVDRARREARERERLALFHAADRMAVSETVAAIPLAYTRNLVAIRSGVEGWWEFGKSWSNFADLTVSR